MMKRLWYVLKISRLLPGSFIACFLFPFTTYAQTDTTNDLHEVNIASSRANFIQSVTPSQQISVSQFSRYSAHNVADAIRNFAGVSIRDYGGIGGLKTVSVRGLGANHVAVLLDGIQLNDAANGQVDLGKLNLNNVQQIALYNGQVPDVLQPARSFASASVLTIQTVKPNLTPTKPYQVTAGLRAGSFGLINPTVQWQQRLNDEWSFVINSYTQYADGKYKYLLNDGATETEQTRSGSAINAQQIDGALYWAKNDSSKFGLRINYYNSDRGLPGAVVLYKEPPVGQRLWNKDIFAQASYKRLWRSGLSLLANSKIGKSDLHYFDPQFPNTRGYLDQTFSQREFYQSAALSYRILPNWEISYAADLVVNNMSSNLSGFKYPTRVTILSALATNLLLGKTTFQASLLNTNLHESVASGKTIPHINVFTPTLMASISPWDNAGVQFRAFYKYIFRVPTFNDLYYGFVVNTNLKPEYTHQYDLGITYNKNLQGFLEYITLTADAYYNNVKDKIVYTPNLYNGSVTNYGKVDITGLDVGLKTEAKLGNAYQALLAVTYSYQKAINVTDHTSSVYLNQLPYIPLNTANINVGVNKAGWGIYYNQLLSSLRYYTNNNLPTDLLPAYAVGDLSLVHKGLFYKLPVTLSAEINNVFDNNFSIVQSYPMPGRSFRISFQITI